MSILDGLIGCWSPSLGASGYRLMDCTRYGNYGTLTNMDAGTDWVAIPPRGMALDFDGTDDYVDFGTKPNLGAATGVTYSAWVYRATVGTMLVMSRYNTSTGTGNIRTDYFGTNTGTTPGQIHVRVGGTNSTDASMFYSTEAIAAAAWSHIAASVVVAGTSTTCVITLNGKPCIVNTAHGGTQPSVIADNNVVLWRSMAITTGGGSNVYYSGRVAEMAVWNTAKPVSELCELARLGNGWIGRELRGLNRRRRAVKGPSFRAAWALRQKMIVGSGGGLG